MLFVDLDGITMASSFVSPPLSQLLIFTFIVNYFNDCISAATKTGTVLAAMKIKDTRPLLEKAGPPLRRCFLLIKFFSSFMIEMISFCFLK